MSISISTCGASRAADTTTLDAPPVQACGPVLLATDGHGASVASYVAASLAAERLGTTVQVAAAVEPYPVVGMDPITAVPAVLATAQREWLAASLRQRLDALPFDTSRWTVTVRMGGVARTVAQLARARDASLIVMGSGRHRLRERMLGGERSLQVLRLTDRPVLSVGAEFAALPRTTVIAMDFSPASVRAARAALRLTANGGHAVLVHVRPVLELPPTSAAGVAAGMSKAELDELLACWSRQAEARVVALFDRLRDELRPSVPRGVFVETRIVRGVVAEEVLRVADEVGAELIATGSQTHGAFERALLGSVATELVRSGARSVLAAPPPDAAESARVELKLRGTVEVERSADWAPVLNAFTRRNGGRRARLEVDDPAIGAQVQQAGLAFLGAAYDARDRRVELMLGDPADGTQHLTRSIPRVSDVALYAGPGGHERALRVLAGRSQTLLTFLE